MGGDRFVAGRHESAEINDVFNAGLFGGAHEVVGEQQVQVGKVGLNEPARRTHGVDEIERIPAAAHRLGEFGQRIEIAVPPFGVALSGMFRGDGRAAGQCAETKRLRQISAQGGAHKTAGAGDDDQGVFLSEGGHPY